VWLKTLSENLGGMIIRMIASLRDNVSLISMITLPEDKSLNEKYSDIQIL